MLYSTEKIIEALERAHGQIYIAAEVLGCSHVTIYRRAKKSKAVQKTIEKYRGQLCDKAVLALEKAVMGGEQWAVTFTLARLGKDRGFSERQEITGAEGGEQVIRVVGIDLNRFKSPNED